MLLFVFHIDFGVLNMLHLGFEPVMSLLGAWLMGDQNDRFYLFKALFSSCETMV